MLDDLWYGCQRFIDLSISKGKYMIITVAVASLTNCAKVAYNSKVLSLLSLDIYFVFATA